MIWQAIDWINHRLPKRQWRSMGNYICDRAVRSEKGRP